jgi:menaquinone-dependent protoporphyrinogen oxidase
MKTAIIYASKHGTTGFVAHAAGKLLINDEVVLFDLKDNTRIELHSFGRIIIGSPVYAGSVLPAVRKFSELNLLELLQKEVGIFVCCMFFDKAEEQLNRGFPEVLRKHARSIKHTGGEFRFDDMNFIERLLVKKMAGATGSISKISFGKIEEFVQELTINKS